MRQPGDNKMDNIKIITKQWVVEGEFGEKSINIEGCLVTSAQQIPISEKPCENGTIKFILESITDFIFAVRASVVLFNYIICVNGHDYIEVTPFPGEGYIRFIIYKNRKRVAEVLGYPILNDTLTSVLRDTIRANIKE